MPTNKDIPITPNTVKALRNQLARVRFSILAVELLRRTTITVSILITLSVGLLFTDLMIDLENNTRSLALFSILTITVILLVWSLFSLITNWKNNETLALDIERKYKSFDSRLISSIQFAKRRITFPQNAPLVMIHKMISEAKDLSKKNNFLKIINPKALIRATLLFFIIMILSGVWAYTERDNFIILIKRALGEQIEIPRDTIILEEP